MGESIRVIKNSNCGLFKGHRLQASLVAQTVKKLPVMWETWAQSLGSEDCLRRDWLPILVFLPGESHGARSLVGYSPRGPRELDTTERLSLFTFTLKENSILIPLSQRIQRHWNQVRSHSWLTCTFLVAQTHCLQCSRLGFNPWVRKIPGEGNGNPL